MAGRIGGLISLTVDGKLFSCKGGFTVSPSTVKREGIAGQDGIAGYTEMPSIPSIKGELNTIPGLACSDIVNITNSVIQVSLANGTTYTLNQAWCTAALEIGTVEGKVGVEFQGISITERTSNATSTTTAVSQ